MGYAVSLPTWLHQNLQIQDGIELNSFGAPGAQLQLSFFIFTYFHGYNIRSLTYGLYLAETTPQYGPIRVRYTHPGKSKSAKFSHSFRFCKLLHVT